MSKFSILPDTLKDFEYYKNKLPMYLKNSYGFIEHFRIWYDLLIGHPMVEYPEISFASGVVNSADILFELLNIFDPDFNDIFRIYNEYDDDDNDLLDKIGALFGVKRYIKLNNEGTIVEKHLSNDDFLTLIKCQIIKDYCDGSREQIEQYYQTVGLIVFAVNDNSSANCELVLNDAGYSDDLKSLFINGMLNISSMGISYTNEVSDVLNIAIWDSSYWPEEEAAVPVWGI